MTGFEASCGLLRSTTAESPPRMGSPSSALQIVRPVVRSMAASLPPEWSVVATSPMSPINCTPDRSSAPISAPVSIASSAYSSGSSDLFVHAATATRTEHSATAPTVRRGRFVVMGNNLVVPEVFLHPSTILTGMPATQHRGSAGSFLRRGQLLAEGSSRSTDVACRGDEPETLVLAQLGLGPIAAVDAGDHPGGVGGGADPHERLGVGVVQLPRQGTDGEGEVGGADIDPVDARHSTDVLDRSEALGVLDHDEQQRTLVPGVLDGAVDEFGGRAPGAVASAGGIVEGDHGGLRLGDGGHEGHDDRFDAGVGERTDLGEAICGDPRSHERGPAGAHGIGQPQHIGGTDQPVLQIEADIVESGRRSDLGKLRTRRHHPQSVVDLPRAEAGPMVLDRCSHACIESRKRRPVPQLPGIRMTDRVAASPRQRTKAGRLGSNVQPSMRYCIAKESSRLPSPCSRYSWFASVSRLRSSSTPKPARCGTSISLFAITSGSRVKLCPSCQIQCVSNAVISPGAAAPTCVNIAREMSKWLFECDPHVRPKSWHICATLTDPEICRKCGSAKGMST